jgi:hypothetical protein
LKNTNVHVIFHNLPAGLQIIMSSHAATVLNGRCSTNRNYPRKSLSDAGYNGVFV